MDVDPGWDLQTTGWRLRVHGDAPFDVRMPFPVTIDELASHVPAFNANGLVNAIPYVCSARPGFLTAEDLPHILQRGPRP
jgi:4-hydroxy-tetrahydrodipicolinate reductase